MTAASSIGQNGPAMNLRTATAADRDAILALHLAAFDESERDVVAKLAVDLLDVDRALHRVAERDGTLVGHVAFSPVHLGGEREPRGSLLAPLGTHPDAQGTGVGSALVRDGLERLRAAGVAVAFVYGDPRYYTRFGFDPELGSRYLPRFELQHPSGWHALELGTGPACAEPVTITCVGPLDDPTLW